MTVLESKSFFHTRFFKILSFILSPILISIGIFISGLLWKILFISLGFILITSLYLSTRYKSKLPKNVCPVCFGTGSVKINSCMISEHAVKNCLSYNIETHTCGMCEGTGKKNPEQSQESKN